METIAHTKSSLSTAPSNNFLRFTSISPQTNCHLPKTSISKQSLKKIFVGFYVFYSLIVAAI